MGSYDANETEDVFNMDAKTAVKVEDKVVKLREERQLLAQFLVIYQSRPELLPNLPGTIGEYEMAVTPRSMFSADGALLIPKDKSSFMHSIEEAVSPNLHSTADGETDDIPLDIRFRTDDDNEFPEYQRSDDQHNSELQKVLILDGMAVLQSMKRGPSVKKISALADQFIKRFERMMVSYLEYYLISISKPL